MPSFGFAAKLLLTIGTAVFHQCAGDEYNKAIIGDFMPPVSSMCTDQSRFTHQAVPDSWHPLYTAGDQLNLQKQLIHNNDDPCKSWKMRIGSGGNIYGLEGCFGETLPDLVNDDALWVDAVYQAVSVNTDLNDNSNQNYWFIHQAGVYQNDGITTHNPFFSPSVNSHCDENGSCYFAGWGQHAWVPMNFTSNVLYFNRYTDCGDGVVEVTNVIHNAADASDPASVRVNRFNVPWGGFRTSILRDFLYADTNNNLKHRYPLQGFGAGDDEIVSVSAIGGYSVFADKLNRPPTNLVDPFDMPCSGGECVQLVIAANNTCVQSVAHTERYTVKCTVLPTVEIDTGCERCNLYFTNRQTGQGVEVPHVEHWSIAGDQLYFHPEDISGVPVELTAEDMNNMFFEGNEIDVAKSTAFRMPCASGGRTVECPKDETNYNNQLVKLKLDRDNGCVVSGYHSEDDRNQTTVRLVVYNTVSNRKGCGQCLLKFVNKRDPTKWIAVKKVRHWSYNERFMYFIPFNAPYYTNTNDPAVSAICDEIDSKFFKDDEIIVQDYDYGNTIDEANGIAHVFGDFSGIIRYGDTSFGKDYTVYTPIVSRTVNPGDSLVSRQYLMVGNLDGIEQRASSWADETLLDTQTIGDSPGRQIHLVSSAGGNSFGVSLESTACGDTVVCSGNTAPQTNLVAHFFASCGAQTYLGPNKYFFTPEADAVRSYECDGQPGIRPQFKFVGYFPKDTCTALQDAALDKTLCSTVSTDAPTSSPVATPTDPPTKTPTKSPTSSPTKNPTKSPTKNPTKSPTSSPTKNPTKSPTSSPTKNPTKSPTSSPTKAPTENLTPNPTKGSTPAPIASPTKAPTKNPTSNPTKLPTKNPTPNPTKAPTESPTSSPTKAPTKSPTSSPTKAPTKNPTSSPTKTLTKAPTESITPYQPGILSEELNAHGLFLSRGLKSKLIAETNQKVPYADGSQSVSPFHVDPYAARIFELPSAQGYVYVSNSEEPPMNGDDLELPWSGGVGAIYFDNEGGVTEYKRLLTGKKNNGGMGKTSWNTLVSCEGHSSGQCWEVDPFDDHPPVKTKLGGSGGKFESFAYDNRDPEKPLFYVTETKINGALRQYKPDGKLLKFDEDDFDPWRILSEKGRTKYLILKPDKKEIDWTDKIDEARENAQRFYRYSEGIAIRDGFLYMTCRYINKLFIIDLEEETYTESSTENGAFENQPGEVARLIEEDEMLYFCEDGGPECGIHARHADGTFSEIVRGGPEYDTETTGLAFSPDKMRMYVAFKDPGYIYEFTREDGQPFDGVKELDIKWKGG